MSNHQVIHICSPALDIEETFSWSDCKPGEFKEENFEVFEAIKWMVQDIQELCHDADLNSFIENFDRTYGCTLDLSNLFNKRVTLLKKQWQSQGLTPAYLTRRASHGFLKFIIQQCYNRAVSDPDKLNQYPPFSPQVYGETSFELVSQMIEHVNISSDDNFIDLGSGVGQVVLQVAASSLSKYCFGIEKAEYPAHCATLLDREFRRWMAFYGKPYRPFCLEKGDFLTEDYREKIVSSGVIFANNFAFGPEVDHQLKLRFANLREGAKIISSKAFCPLNFRITDRNLGDIGSIMHVSCLNPIQDAVSWTDKPFVYYVHTIDRSLLERYFSRLKNPNAVPEEPEVRRDRKGRIISKDQLKDCLKPIESSNDKINNGGKRSIIGNERAARRRSSSLSSIRSSLNALRQKASRRPRISRPPRLSLPDDVSGSECGGSDTMLTATSGNQNNLVNSASEHGSINRRTEDYHYRHKHRHRRRSNDQLSRIQRQKQDRHSLHLENGHHYPETLIAKPLNKFITGDHISIVPVHRTRGRPVARRPTHENTDISSHRSTSSSLSPVKRAPIDQSPGLTQRPGSLTPLTANAAHLESPHSSTTTTLTPMSTPTTTAATTPCSPPSQPLLGSLSPERRRGRPPGLPSRNGVSDSINPTGPLSILSELADSLEPASNFHRPRREYNVMDQDISRPRHNEPALSNQLYNLLLESSNGTTTCPPDSASTTHVVLAARGLQTSNSAPVLNSASSLSVANPNSSSPFSSSSSSSSISSSSIYADSHSSFPTASTQNSLTNAVDQKNRSCSKTSTTDSSLDMEINEEDDHQESCSTIDDRTISAVSPHDSSVSLGKDEVENVPLRRARKRQLPSSCASESGLDCSNSNPVSDSASLPTSSNPTTAIRHLRQRRQPFIQETSSVTVSAADHIDHPRTCNRRPQSHRLQLSSTSPEGSAALNLSPTSCGLAMLHSRSLLLTGCRIAQTAAEGRLTSLSCNDSELSSFLPAHRTHNFANLNEAKEHRYRESGDLAVGCLQDVVPLSLVQYLELTKQVFMDHFAMLRSPVYRAQLLREVQVERQRHEELLRRKQLLEEVIDKLHVEGCSLLSNFTKRIGILISTPAAFFAEARKLIKHHNALEERISELRHQISELSASNQLLVKKHQLEAAKLSSHMAFANRSSGSVGRIKYASANNTIRSSDSKAISYSSISGNKINMPVDSTHSPRLPYVKNAGGRNSRLSEPVIHSLQSSDSPSSISSRDAISSSPSSASSIYTHEIRTSIYNTSPLYNSFPVCLASNLSPSSESRAIISLPKLSASLNPAENSHPELSASETHLQYVQPSVSTGHYPSGSSIQQIHFDSLSTGFLNDNSLLYSSQEGHSKPQSISPHNREQSLPQFHQTPNHHLQHNHPSQHYNPTPPILAREVALTGQTTEAFNHHLATHPPTLSPNNVNSHHLNQSRNSLSYTIQGDNGNPVSYIDESMHLSPHRPNTNSKSDVPYSTRVAGCLQGPIKTPLPCLSSSSGSPCKDSCTPVEPSQISSMNGNMCGSEHDHSHHDHNHYSQPQLFQQSNQQKAAHLRHLQQNLGRTQLSASGTSTSRLDVQGPSRNLPNEVNCASNSLFFPSTSLPDNSPEAKRPKHCSTIASRLDSTPSYPRMNESLLTYPPPPPLLPIHRGLLDSGINEEADQNASAKLTASARDRSMHASLQDLIAEEFARPSAPPAASATFIIGDGSGSCGAFDSLSPSHPISHPPQISPLPSHLHFCPPPNSPTTYTVSPPPFPPQTSSIVPHKESLIAVSTSSAQPTNSHTLTPVSSTYTLYSSDKSVFPVRVSSCYPNSSSFMPGSHLTTSSSLASTAPANCLPPRKRHWSAVPSADAPAYLESMSMGKHLP